MYIHTHTHGVVCAFQYSILLARACPASVGSNDRLAARLAWPRSPAARLRDRLTGSRVPEEISNIRHRFWSFWTSLAHRRISFHYRAKPKTLRGFAPAPPSLVAGLADAYRLYHIILHGISYDIIL